MPDPADEPQATTAAEQDHADPWAYAGEDTDAPASTETDRAAGGPR